MEDEKAGGGGASVSASASVSVMAEEKRGGSIDLVQELIEIVDQISTISDFRNAFRKQFCNLARRLKLLAPMLEELRESKEAIEEEVMRDLVALKEALVKANDLLRFGSHGSKICLVLEGDNIVNRFQELTTQLEQALSAVVTDKLDISDEVKEQVELVHAQFKRARGRIDAPDMELYDDLSSAYNSDADVDPAILRRLAEKLQLTSLDDLKQESLSLYDMVAASDGDPRGGIEKVSMLLRKIKDFVQTENPDMASPANSCLPSSGAVRVPTDGNAKSPAIPDDFRCPISLELMKDPVVVSTGQTYERSCIKKWLDDGHGTCPKTQQSLTSTALTPNYVLRSLIAQWCEANGIDPPKRPVNSNPIDPTSVCSCPEHAKVVDLICKLSSSSVDDQCSAAGELRVLARRSADNRVCIAAAGAIPLLISLLPTTDPNTQEHAVTALLNLSICIENKRTIVSLGAVPGIVQVLKKGNVAAQENAAASLFSLSVLNENKVIIGNSLGAIPALVALLGVGSPRGKKDAVTALFNLCIYQGNKGKAVRAGLVATLMRMVVEPSGLLVDEALVILAILASDPEGKAAIAAAKAVSVLVDIIESGTPRNRENAAAVLVNLCSGDWQHLAEAQELGVMGPLLDLAQHGTDRGKRKAVLLLDRISRFMK
eukprot:TRINITY_DN3722_c0_g1_i4.p1 TRINITY_DN3722_c0_g1~~TRINITY_DN3722_c0_g1_i4.p1  ORF type:complete len:658 (+),score=156.88 TRINITY_DN3722_c0_g1_i4:218-2191(+)